jgi:hypothetical protein
MLRHSPGEARSMTGQRMTDRTPPGWSGGTIRGDRLAMAAVVALVLALTVPPMGAGADGHELTGVVYDIEAVADGSILIAENTRVMELRRGELTLVADLPTAVGEGPIGTPATGAVNGLAATARGDVFATTGGIDAAQGAALWRVSRGTARQVADIAAFEVEHDPDAAEGSRWKHPRCEEAAGYSPARSRTPTTSPRCQAVRTLIADAAGNTLLVARTNGDVDWVAVFPRPTTTQATGWSSRSTRASSATSSRCRPLSPSDPTGRTTSAS